MCRSLILIIFKNGSIQSCILVQDYLKFSVFRTKKQIGFSSIKGFNPFNLNTLATSIRFLDNI